MPGCAYFLMNTRGSTTQRLNKVAKTAPAAMISITSFRSSNWILQSSMGGKCYQRFNKVLILCYIPADRNRPSHLPTVIPTKVGIQTGRRRCPPKISPSRPLQLRRLRSARHPTGPATPANAYFLSNNRGNTTQSPNNPAKTPPAIKISITQTLPLELSPAELSPDCLLTGIMRGDCYKRIAAMLTFCNIPAPYSPAALPHFRDCPDGSQGVFAD